MKSLPQVFFTIQTPDFGPSYMRQMLQQMQPSVKQVMGIEVSPYKKTMADSSTSKTAWIFIRNIIVSEDHSTSIIFK